MISYKVTTLKGQRVLHFGATQPPISDQLKDSGLNSEQINRHDEDDKAITRLLLRGIIDEKTADSSRRKVGVCIQRTITPMLKSAAKKTSLQEN